MNVLMNVLLWGVLWGLTGGLSGCATGSVVKEGMPVYGNTEVVVSTYDKIRADHVKLTFEVVKGDPQGHFDWQEVAEDVVDELNAKGIKVSDSGLPVTVKLQSFVATSGPYAPGGVGVLGGGLLALGGSLAQAVAVSVAEKVVTDTVTEERNADIAEQNVQGPQLCDTANCYPSVAFSIHAPDYEAEIELIGKAAISNPASYTEMITVIAIGDMFEKASEQASRPQ